MPSCGAPRHPARRHTTARNPRAAKRSRTASHGEPFRRRSPIRPAGRTGAEPAPAARDTAPGSGEHRLRASPEPQLVAARTRIRWWRASRAAPSDRRSRRLADLPEQAAVDPCPSVMAPSLRVRCSDADPGSLPSRLSAHVIPLGLSSDGRPPAPAPPPLSCVRWRPRSRRGPPRSSVIAAAPIQPSTCSGVRAPTIAPVTPGQASVQAMATATTMCRAARRSAAARRAGRGSGASSAPGTPASARRQSSAASAATRSA